MPNIYVAHSSCHRGLFKVSENPLKYSDFRVTIRNAPQLLSASKSVVISAFAMSASVFGEKMNNSELSTEIYEIME